MASQRKTKTKTVLGAKKGGRGTAERLVKKAAAKAKAQKADKAAKAKSKKPARRDPASPSDKDAQVALKRFIAKEKAAGRTVSPAQKKSILRGLKISSRRVTNKKIRAASTTTRKRKAK